MHRFLLSFALCVVAAKALAGPESAWTPPPPGPPPGPVVLVNYVRNGPYDEYNSVFHGLSPSDSQVHFMAKPYWGKRLDNIAPIESIVVWRNYNGDLSVAAAQHRVPPGDIFWILHHYWLRSNRYGDEIQGTRGDMVDIHYSNGYTLRINTWRRTPYTGIWIDPHGYMDTVGFE